jgi:peptidoglycan L-alanyl-D-glutamate endopeptidase CwlK
MITLKQAQAITREKVATLEPTFRAQVEKWLKLCEERGILVYVYCGFRTAAEQDALFAKGPQVTRARAGQSFHNYRAAIDWVPLIPHEKAAGFYEAGWNATSIYIRAQALAASFGLRALTWETPHLEDARYKDWRALAAVRKPV